MTTSFPTGLDSLTNPVPGDPTNAPSHAGQHTDANDAVEALEAKVGVDGSAVTSSLDYQMEAHAHTSAADDGADFAGYFARLGAAQTFTADQTFAGALIVGTTLVADQSLGRVGIGTAAPSQPLHIKTAGPVIRLEDTDVPGSAGYLAYDGAYLSLATANGSSGRKVAVEDGATDDVLWIDCGTPGRIGILTEAPGAALDIDLSSAVEVGLIVQGAAGQSAYLQKWMTSTGTLLSAIYPNGDFYRRGAYNDTVIRSEVTGDSYPRHGVQVDGVTEWGPGNVAADTNLYRSAANILKTDDKLHVVGDLELDADLNHDGNNIGFFGVAPAARASAYTPTNVVADRSYNADATTVEELADVLGTLIADLQAYGLLS